MPRYDNDVPKGYGLVTYMRPEDGINAFRVLGETEFKNKIVFSPEQSGKVPTTKLEGNYTFIYLNFM